MFLLVLFSGFFTLTLCDLQYVFVNQSKTWAEAQRYCRDKYTDLATIENEQQTVQLLHTVNDDSVDLAWIGLYDDLNSWKWTLEDSDFFKAGEKDFRNWYNTDPYSNGAQSLCVYMYYGIWYKTVCSSSLYPTVCYDGRKNASATYVVIYQYNNWTEAQSYCREHHTDLISIRNETENQKIAYILKSNNYAVWIGLYKTRSWSDQSNSSFSYWSSGQPDISGSCTVVSFSVSWKWADENCNYAFPFICYSVLGSSRQYYFVNQSMIWTEAQRFCRQNYTDLATIDNMEEMNRLINTVNGSYSGSAWIGQYDDVNSWRWSLEDNDFYQKGEKDYRNFYHEPDNMGGNDLCVYMDSNGKWSDMSCEYTRQFVCYDGRENASQSYIRIYNSKNWTEARRYCRDYYTDLVNVRNQTENQKILERTGGGVWIGLYRNRVWSNNQNTTYQNWRPQISGSQAQPDNGVNQGNENGYQHCTAVSFRYSGRWTDEVCVSRMPFFCYSRSCTQYSCTRQYHFISESKTWTEAQRFCRQNYTDLATIDNMEEMKSLIKTVRGTFYGKAWIGLYDDLDSWRWSLDNTALQGGFKSWYVQQPVNWAGQSLCVYLSSYRGTWSEFPCSQIKLFVCYDALASSRQYYFVSESMNWTEAQRYCRQSYTDLATIDNIEEMNRLINTVNGSYSGSAWIGLYDDVNSWKWSLEVNDFYQQGERDYRNWFHEPNNMGGKELCVYMQHSGSWFDLPCDGYYPFVCYNADSNTCRKMTVHTKIIMKALRTMFWLLRVRNGQTLRATAERDTQTWPV